MYVIFQPRQNLLNAASRVGEASTTVLHTIGEETEEDKETQVTDSTDRRSKKSYLYRKLNYCYDNFYKVFFNKEKEYDSDFENVVISDDCKVKYEDDGLYEDVDTSRDWGMLEAIQEESDSDYYRSLDYCNALFTKGKPVTLQDINNIHDVKEKFNNTDRLIDFESILQSCEGYLDQKNENKGETPKLYPKTITDKIYDFKKDFSNHNYANVNHDHQNNDYENVNFDKKSKNDILREKFFLSESNNDKNDINDRFNKYNGKKIECHSIRNDVTKTGPDVKVSGALNMKLVNLDKYNRVLTTTETFMEKAEASFTKNELSKMNKDNLESFLKRSEKYYTTESRDRTTTVELNNSKDPKAKTEIRIFYNPTFRATGTKNIRGFCQFCRRRCPRTEDKCCSRCICLELELKMIWKEHWLNILCFLGMIFVLMALLVQSCMPKDVCDGSLNMTDPKCFEMIG